MKQRYKLSKLAEKDLTGIWRYTMSTWSVEQADKYIAGLIGAIEDIARNPLAIGRSYEHVRIGYRKHLWGSHRIFYRILPDNIPFIVRVLHQKMDYDRHLST